MATPNSDSSFVRGKRARGRRGTQRGNIMTISPGRSALPFDPCARCFRRFIQAPLRLGAAFVLALVADGVHAGLSGLEQLTSGQGQITVLKFAPGETNRLFVGNRAGEIRVFNLTTGAFETESFLSIAGLDLEVEGGLLGMAFHPDYATNGKFYVNVTVDNGGIPIDATNVSPFSTHIRQYGVSANPNVANTTFVDIDRWVQPQAWHNGGWLDFSPDDGYLYISSGDGGAAFDQGPGHTPGTGNARDLTDNRLGKLLRIDVDGDAFPADPLRNYAVPADNPFVGVEGDDEIFAYGLRNVWQASFDRATGDLWLGDVGEAWREEIDLLPAGSGGGQNFGWNMREGMGPSPVGGPLEDAVDPVYDYQHSGQPGDANLAGNSVTGGFRYRGPDPDLQGKYLFADFSLSKYFMFDADAPGGAFGSIANVTSQLPVTAGSANLPTVFAEDAVGNLYVATVTGQVFRVVTDAVTPGDFDVDADVDADDLAVWRANFGTDEGLEGADFLEWQRHLGWDAATPSFGSGAAAPEPSSVISMACAVVGGLAMRTRRTP
jgi:glucose/arabinose dehydrogenase